MYVPAVVSEFFLGHFRLYNACRIAHHQAMANVMATAAANAVSNAANANVANGSSDADENRRSSRKITFTVSEASSTDPDEVSVSRSKCCGGGGGKNGKGQQRPSRRYRKASVNFADDANENKESFTHTFVLMHQGPGE
jgi:hypothetical protein